MPPFDLTPGARNLLGQWGAVVGSVFERLPTAQLASAIRNAQVDAGVEPGGYTMQDLNRLRQLANSWRLSAETMATAQADTSLRNAVALAPWSRDLNARNISPALEIRYEYLRNTEEGLQRDWVTIPSEQISPLGTVGMVRGTVAEHAEEVTGGGGSPPLGEDESFAGIGNIIVLAL